MKNIFKVTGEQPGVDVILITFCVFTNYCCEKNLKIKTSVPGILFNLSPPLFSHRFTVELHRLYIPTSLRFNSFRAHHDQTVCT
jgi:hypothetical protein